MVGTDETVVRALARPGGAPAHDRRWLVAVAGGDPRLQTHMAILAGGARARGGRVPELAEGLLEP